MFVVRLEGRLGNQMFQYAFAYALMKKMENQSVLDTSFFKNYQYEYALSVLNIELKTVVTQKIKRKRYHLISRTHAFYEGLFQSSIPFLKNYLYMEKSFHFDSGVFDAIDNTYYQGYWQSEKYFSNYRKDLLLHFAPKNRIHKETENYLESISGQNAVSLHVRRGDYILDKEINQVHGVCSVEYYKNAIALIMTKVKSPRFFLFSDDIAWVKEEFSFIEDAVAIEFRADVPDHEEMYLMSQCDHNIIANSSFSWWGAWLNANSDKVVVAPKKWFNSLDIASEDIIPDSWVKL